jgi:hypothetical protein
VSSPTVRPPPRRADHPARPRQEAKPPFGRIELVETLWWHPDRATTAEHAWLRRTLTEAAASLPPVASESAAVRPMLALGLQG